jgi:Zn-dependent M28 family amino/carboxypeptidase
VVGVIPGTVHKEKMIIFSAHYDHIGTNASQKAIPFGSVKKYVKGDSIYNGANDNASGVAAMLELARLFSQSQPSYTLMFVAFSGEELGLLGSTDFLTNLKSSTVKMNVNLEMLGRANGGRPFVVENEGKNYMLRMLNNNLYRAGTNYIKDYFATDPYPEQSLFTRSDHYSFHKRGIPAFTLMATDPEDEFYHSADDEVENIQFDQMQKIVQAIYLAMLPVVMDEK